MSPEALTAFCALSKNNSVESNAGGFFADVAAGGLSAKFTPDVDVAADGGNNFFMKLKIFII